MVYSLPNGYLEYGVHLLNAVALLEKIAPGQLPEFENEGFKAARKVVQRRASPHLNPAADQSFPG